MCCIAITSTFVTEVMKSDDNDTITQGVYNELLNVSSLNHTQLDRTNVTYMTTEEVDTESTPKRNYSDVNTKPPSKQESIAVDTRQQPINTEPTIESRFVDTNSKPTNEQQFLSGNSEPTSKQPTVSKNNTEESVHTERGYVQSIGYFESDVSSDETSITSESLTNQTSTTLPYASTPTTTSSYGRAATRHEHPRPGKSRTQ